MSNEVPNVVITNPDARKAVSTTLYVVFVVAGLATLFFAFFPEFGGDIWNRAIMFANAAVSLIAGAFGLSVSRPNIPSIK